MRRAEPVKRYRHQARTLDDPSIYAITDVHGHLDLLKRLEEIIHTDSAVASVANPVAVYLGIYVDQWPNSRALLYWMIRYPFAGLERVLFKGKH